MWRKILRTDPDHRLPTRRFEIILRTKNFRGFMAIPNLSQSTRSFLHSQLQQAIDNEPKRTVEEIVREARSRLPQPGKNPRKDPRKDPWKVQPTPLGNAVKWIGNNSTAIAGTALAIIVAIGSIYAASRA